MRSALLRCMRGFSLVEVMAATAVLLTGAAAATGLFSLACRTTAHQGSLAGVREACQTTAESLLALPFRASDGEHDLLSSVFPHADPARNTATAKFVADDESTAQPASFVTRRQDGALTTVTVATFVRPSGIQLEPLPMEQVLGWSGEPGGPAPSDTLLISITVSDEHAAAGATLVAAADREVGRMLEEQT